MPKLLLYPGRSSCHRLIGSASAPGVRPARGLIETGFARFEAHAFHITSLEGLSYPL